MTIIVECEQGSLDWHYARAGVITASNFAMVRKRVNGLDERQARLVSLVRDGGMDMKDAAAEAGYKSAPTSERIKRAINGEAVGDYTDAALNYAMRVAVERINMAPLDEGFQGWEARRGQELEPVAREKHAARIGREITPTGIVLTDDSRFGASADGLIGDDGGSEYKCFIAPEKLRTILIDGDTSDLADQVQGCMWLTGRTWWDLVLYCPALEAAGKDVTIFRQERDDDYIAALERDLWEFERLVSHYQAVLEDRPANEPMNEEPAASGWL